MADFSIVIPAYNEGERLLHTMVSVVRSLTGRYRAELLVVDDYSDDDTLAVAEHGANELAREDLRVEAVPAPSRSGVALARNVGQAQVSTDVTVFLDAHSVPGRGALEALVEPLLSSVEIVLTGPTFVPLPAVSAGEQLTGVLRDIKPEQYEYPRVMRTIKETKVAYGRGQRLQDYSLKLQWMPFRAVTRPERLEIIPGGCTAVRTDRWGTHPYEGYDTGMAFPWGGEDAELSLRAWRLGHEVVFDPQGVVATEYRKTPNYGIGGATLLFNRMRLANLFLSDEVIERVIDHYRNDPNLTWVLAHMLVNSDTLDRRRELDRMGPPEMRNLTLVFAEFGGLDVTIGQGRSRMLSAAARTGGATRGP